MLSITATVGADSEGHATLSTTGCSFSIGHLKVKFHGGARLYQSHSIPVLSMRYSGNPLLWTPWGPGQVSCIETCPHFRNPSKGGRLGDLVKCPV